MADRQIPACSSLTSRPVASTSAPTARIYRLLNNLAREGKSIIMISSELPEVLRMSHRILVMCEGRITGELKAGEATQEAIMHFATQRGTQ